MAAPASALKHTGLNSVRLRLGTLRMRWCLPPALRGKPNPDRLVDNLSGPPPTGPRKRKLKFLGIPDDPPQRRRRGPDPDEPLTSPEASPERVSRLARKPQRRPARKFAARRALAPALGSAPATEALGAGETDASPVFWPDPCWDEALGAQLDAAIEEMYQSPEEPPEAQEPPDHAVQVAATMRELDACFGAALGPREIDPLQILYSHEAALPRELDLGHEAAEDRALAEFGRLSEEEVNRLPGPAMRRLCTLNHPCEARLAALQALECAPRRFAERAAHLQALNAPAKVRAGPDDLRRAFLAAATRMQPRTGGLHVRRATGDLLAKHGWAPAPKLAPPPQPPAARAVFVDVWREARNAQGVLLGGPLGCPNFRVRVV